MTVFDHLAADAGNDTSIVKNTVADLRALIPDGVNAGNFTFRWTPEDMAVDEDLLETRTERLDQTTTFTLTVTNRYYDECSSSDEKVVMVYDQAVADFSANDVCLGDTTYFRFTGSVIPEAEYSWDFGDGSGASDLKDPCHIYGTAGQFVVTMTISTADSDSTISKSVSVYGIPAADFTADEVCFGNETTLTADEATDAKAYNWDFDNDGNIDASTTVNSVRHAFASAGLHTVALTVISENGCVSDSVNRNVRVHFAPAADAGPDQTIGYKDAAALTGDDGTGAGYDEFLFRWSPADKVEDADAQSTQTVRLEETTTFVLTVTNRYSDECLGIDSVTVTVEGGPLTAQMAVDGDSICENASATASVIAANGVGDYRYRWEPEGYFTNPEDAVTTFLPDDIYSVSETVTITCTVTSGDETVVVSRDMTVFDHLAADAGNDTAIVYNTAADLMAIVPDGVNAGNFTFRWTPEDLVVDHGTATTKTVSLTSSQTYTLTVTNKAFGGCASSDDVTVTISGGPLTLALYADNDSICDNGLTTLNAVAAGGSEAYIYSWYPAEGLDDATSDNPTFTPDDISEAFKTYTFHCEVCDGYNTVRDSVNIVVTNTPEASFTTENICLGEKVTFNATAINGATYAWNFGDGSVDTTVTNTTSHEYLTANRFTVTLTVISEYGCVSEEFSDVVDVFEVPVAEFTADNVCLGEETVFSATTVDGATYTWNFGDGSVDTTVTNTTSHEYLTANRFTVTLTVISEYGCVSEEFSDDINIFEIPVAEFTADDVCLGEETVFSATTVDGATYAWNFGDGSVDTTVTNTISHEYLTADKFTVTLTVISEYGCVSEEFSDVVDVFEVPIAEFTADNACLGEETVFSATTVDGATYTWNFGDGSVNIETEVPTIMYEYSYLNQDDGYEVTLFITSEHGCVSAPVTSIVKVFEAPVAEFTVDDVCLGDVTTFTATSMANAKAYEWDFGDGNTETSTSNTITHEYLAADSYTVTLKVISEHDCESSIFSKIANVYDLPIAQFTAQNVCLGDTMSFHATETVGAAYYTWDFGDGTTVTSISNDTLHYYANDGIYDVTLVVMSQGDCESIPATVSVEVYEIPVAEFTADDVCLGEEVIFSATTVDGATYTWNFGDGSDNIVTTVPTIAYEYSAANQDEGYEVTLVVTSAHGCESVPVINTVKVFETLEADAGPDQVIPYGTKTTIGAIVPEDVNADNFNFHWEPAELLVNPNSLTTETKYHITTSHTFTLTVTNKLNSDCYDTDDVFIDIIGDALVVTDTICDDGVSYPDGRYWLYDEEGWDFAFPGRYQGEGDVTIDEYGNLMKVEYDITLLNELKASEIGLGSNAQMVYHLGLGFDFYVFDIIEVTGGGTDEDIDGFENVAETYDWTLEMVDGGTAWTLDPNADTTNIMSINVKSDGIAYLRCYISSLCGTIEKWILLYTPGYEPCRNVSDLQAKVTNSTTAEIKWQRTTDKYEVRYGTDSRCTESIITTENHLTIEDLEPNTTYYWKVRSICEDETLNIGFVDGPTFITYDIVMYPNPAYDKVTIEGKNLSSIELYNALGVMVYSEKEIVNNMTVVNTSSFSRGLYFVRYTLSNGDTNIMRLVIE